MHELKPLSETPLKPNFQPSSAVHSLVTDTYTNDSKLDPFVLHKPPSHSDAYTQPISTWSRYSAIHCVRLMSCLLDPLASLINHISSEVLSDISSHLANSCFICVHVHRFPVCIPSFCKKGKSLKPKHQLLRKQLWR